MKISISIIVLSIVVFTIFMACKPKATAVNGISYNNIDISALSTTLANNKAIVLLDVRTPEETANGMISKDALKINFFDDNFETQIAQLDKNKTYLVYCKSGGRSAKSAQKMINLGFTKVSNLEGGYTAFKNNSK